MNDLKSRITVLAGAAILVILIMLGTRNLAGRKNPDSYQTMNRDFASMRYPYQQLNEREQQLYSALYQGISDYQETITLPGSFTAEEYKRVYLLVATQEPELFYLDRVYETSENMQKTDMYYCIPRESAESMQKQMNTAADAILGALSPTQSDWQKLLMIHDRIGAGCFYGEGLHADNAYGCLVEGVARCEGYAQAFLFVARRAGIHAMCVPGETADGTAHIWNIAEIDGKYYNIDLTWDDSESYDGRTAHSCFAVPDSAFADHIPDTTILTPPVCTDAMRTYYQMYGMTLNEVHQLSERLRGWYGQVPSGLIEFRCTSPQMYAEVKAELQSATSARDTLTELTGADKTRIVADEKRAVIVIMI